MTVRKLAHSCILVRKERTTLLFDPGTLVPPGVRAEIGAVDAVILTHSHRDHFDPELVATLATTGAHVYAPQELTLELIRSGVAAQALRPNAVLTVGDFSLQVLVGAHEPLPRPVPENAPVLVDGRLLHVGDSLHVDAPQGVELLALPYAAPWGTMLDAIACVERLRPARVLPVHDGFYIDAFREGQQANLATALEPLGVEVVGTDRTEVVLA